jgi:serine/threonine-protein kinase
MQDLSGKTFRRGYRLIRLVGEGAMGQVYEATSLRFGKVALKILRTELTADRRFAERFKVEAESLRELRHEHIVPAHDHFEEDGFFCLVLKFIEGESLAQRLDRVKRLPMRQAIAIMDALLAALDHAHIHGIIHRDLKPSNILLHPEDGPMLCDFGIARRMGDRRITGFGRCVGTPQYMSPEQIRGIDEPSHATDVYASGVLLFEMLTGRVPFDAGSETEIYHQHIYGEPPRPRELNPEIDPELEYVILKALRKERRSRFQGCGEFRLRLVNVGSPRLARMEGGPPGSAGSGDKMGLQHEQQHDGTMPTWRIFEHADLRVVAVRKGFSVKALLGNIAWMAQYGLYGRAALWSASYTGLILLWNAAPDTATRFVTVALVAVLSLLPGFRANRWIESELARLGFEQLCEVAAADEREAIETTIMTSQGALGP